MPVTKTAKRALRVSKRKTIINKAFNTKLEIAIRMAKKRKRGEEVRKAISLVDKAVKRKLMHKNKAARIKSSLAKLLAKTPTKKSSSAKSKSKK